MSDDLIERMQESTYDPETREILDLGAFAHLAVADVCMARLRLEQAAAALIAKDAEIARLREALRGIAETSNYTRSEWMQERARSALLAEAEKVEAEDVSDDDWKADLSLMQYNALKGKMP